MKKTIITPSCRAVLTALLVSTTTLLTLPSCSNIAGQGIVREKVSQFDGSKSITMSPAVVMATSTSTQAGTLLGARWSNKTPNTVYLILEHNSQVLSRNTYSNINSLAINVDGKIYRYKCTTLTDHSSGGYNSVTKTIYTNSRNVVAVPLSLVKRMVAANRCMLQVHTSTGVHEQNFAKEKNMGVSMAKVHMRKFLAQVAAAR